MGATVGLFETSYEEINGYRYLVDNTTNISNDVY